MRKTQIRDTLVALIGLSLLSVILQARAQAQTNGYLTNGANIFTFNEATGAITNTFNSAATAQLAVSPDGTKLYQANYGILPEAGLRVLDSATGQILSTILLPVTNPFKVLLSPNGKTAYVAALNGVAVVNLPTAKVTAVI